MTKLIFLSLITLLTLKVYGQKSKHVSSFNTCPGAINIFENGNFNLEFTGSKDIDFIASYPSLNSINKTNQIWCSYIAASSGTLSFKASTTSDFLQMVVFTQEVDDICGEIQKGVAEIKRLHTSKSFKQVGLDTNVRDGFVYSLKLRQGEKIHVLFATVEEKKIGLNLDWQFKSEVIIEQKSKIVDKRNDDFAPTFSIVIRDGEKNTPIVASVEVLNSKQFDAVYRGSDLFFNTERKTEISLLCKADGYFFDEQIVEVNPN